MIAADLAPLAVVLPFLGAAVTFILIRHAQSEGNKNREIHQLIPDHRVKLTDDGWVQVTLSSFLSRPSSETVIN